MVSSPLHLGLLFGRSEDGSSICATRGGALEPRVLLDFILCHKSRHRAANIFIRAVSVAHFIRINDFLTEAARLFTAGAEGDNMETHFVRELRGKLQH